MCLGSGIQDPRSGIRKTYSGSKGQKGTGSQIRNTAKNVQLYYFLFYEPVQESFFTVFNNFFMLFLAASCSVSSKYV
jgi:hypothetical protein